MEQKTDTGINPMIIAVACENTALPVFSAIRNGSEY